VHQVGEGVLVQVLDLCDRLALLGGQEVLQHCLYGVDRNPMVVDLAKLSLWLVTLPPTESLRQGRDVEPVRQVEW
jgi:hypothetical protein